MTASRDLTAANLDDSAFGSGISMLVGQVLRYISVGAISAAAELGLFHIATKIADFPVMTANVAAVGCVTVFGFVAQKRFTFRDRQKSPKQAGLYLVMVAISVALNNALVFLFAIRVGMPPTIAKVLQLACGFAFNFSASKFIVFRLPR